MSRRRTSLSLASSFAVRRVLAMLAGLVTAALPADGAALDRFVGAAASLDEVLQNVTHRSAGTGGVDTLTSAADRAKVVSFLRSIDAASQPVPAP